MYFNKQEIEKNSYILANNGIWFYRFCDTGFRNKWCGLWKGSKKFLEYYAVKINDEWLSPESMVAFEYNDDEAVHEFKLKEVEVKEKVTVENGLVVELEVKNNTNKSIELKVLLELAANIRRKVENWHEGEYSTALEDNGISIKNELGKLIMKFNFPFLLTDFAYTKTHYPSGEMSKCFIPGNVVTTLSLDAFQRKSLALYFFLDSVQQLVAAREKEACFKGPIGFLNRLFETARKNLKKLEFDDALFAGYPWYTEVWGRDLAWEVQALVNLGEFEKAKSSLLLLAKHQSDTGKIPNIVSSEGVAYNSSDSTPLWIISLDKYIAESGDILFLDSMKEKIQKAFNLYLASCDERGFVKSEKFSTWCDTMERGSYCIDVQALWYAALKSLERLFGLLNDEYQKKEAKELSLKLEKNIEKEFYDGKFFKDNLENPYYSANAIFPIILGIEKESVLEIMESEKFTGAYGIRNVSKDSLFFDPAGYHSGASWGLINGLMALAEFKFNRIENGLKYLKVIHEMSNKLCINCLPEAWNPETGELILRKPVGYEQAAFLLGMTSAAVIKAIDEGFLGIDVDALRKTIYIKPALKDGSYFRRKRIGSDWVDILIKRKGKSLGIKYKSDKGLEYKVVVVPRV